MRTDPTELYQQAYARAYDANWEVLSGGDSTDSILSLVSEAIAENEPGGWLDLGCGSGRTLQVVGEVGFAPLYGLDCVEANLEIAREVIPHASFTLGTAPTGVSVADILGEDRVQVVSALGCTLGCFDQVKDLEGMFQLIAACLAPGGVWIADINTVAGMEANDGEGHGFTGDYGALIIQIHFEEKQNTARWAVTGFTPDQDGQYHKYEETHYQKAWEVNTLANAAMKAGLSFEVMDAETLGPVEEESWQLLLMGRKEGP